MVVFVFCVYIEQLQASDESNSIKPPKENKVPSYLASDNGFDLFSVHVWKGQMQGLLCSVAESLGSKKNFHIKTSNLLHKMTCSDIFSSPLLWSMQAMFYGVLLTFTGSIYCYRQPKPGKEIPLNFKIKKHKIWNLEKTLIICFRVICSPVECTCSPSGSSERILLAQDPKAPTGDDICNVFGKKNIIPDQDLQAAHQRKNKSFELNVRNCWIYR